MNWNRPVADDDLALAAGSRLDSRTAVLSRYSNPAPVTLAASRIAPVTRVAASVVTPLMRAAKSTAASIAISAPSWRHAFPPVGTLGSYGKRPVNADSTAATVKERHHGADDDCA